MKGYLTAVVWQRQIKRSAVLLTKQLMPGALCQISICITWVPNGLSISHGHQNPRNFYTVTLTILSAKKHSSQFYRLVSARQIRFIRMKPLNYVLLYVHIGILKLGMLNCYYKRSFTVCIDTICI